MTAYYNEFDPHAADWLRNLIAEGLIADGIVDSRPIQEVTPDDLKGFKQAHFFAGIGGWSYALRLAGWSDERPVWTGSCPCQAFSVAGKREGASDERHLWPDWFRLIEKCSPPTVFGEQVKGAINFGWLDAVAHDFESKNYAFASSILSGFTVGAYHKRQRLWFVGYSEHAGSSPSTVRGSVEASGNDTKKGSNIPSELEGTGRSKNDGSLDKLADTNRTVGGCGRLEKQPQGRSVGQCAEDGSIDLADTNNTRSQGRLQGRSNEERQSVNRHAGRGSAVDWSAVEWVECADGKTRPIPLEPGLQPLVNGLPKVVDREGNSHRYSYTNTLKGVGNAIIPQVAALFISAFRDITE